MPSGGCVPSGPRCRRGDAAGCAEEDEVPGFQRCAGGEQKAGVVLGLGGAGDVDAGGGVGGVGEAGAVQAGIPVAAPDVGLAELGAREPDSSQRCAGPVRDGVLAR
jgi:hypothetical protein